MQKEACGFKTVKKFTYFLYSYIFSANEESQSFAEKRGKDKLP